MRIPIDIQKSKTLRALVFHKNGFDKVSEYLTEFITLFALLLLPATFILKEYQNHKSIILPITTLMVTIFIISGIIYSIFNTSKLRILIGKSIDKNKSDVEKISELKKWKVIDEGRDYMTLLVADKWSGFHSGKFLTIIFQNNELLFNSYCTDVFGAISPYHWFGNRKVEKEFVSQIGLLNNVP
ncbi:hypothetical protein SAMN04488009_2269 [Maribacter sedimenticola]|uniref:YcxB-like protein n=1 Tax=Maribacter sedimenticola TaxID=228956 RepID=A0ABY1SHK1_9FLAO|nr:hypothetical protein [Maribacter sedimenticola]SNR54251.1 hypothetical protein SAMN04488009_2269 [Maribacter sedimenticola]